MNKEKFSLKIEWCQKITEVCLIGRANFPKKWGDKSIPEDEQLLGKEDLGALLPVLREQSPWLQGHGEGFRTIFGRKSDWHPVDKDGKKITDFVDEYDPLIVAWKINDPSTAYSVELDREALSGIVWCCILRLHPQTGVPTSTRDAVDVWWPISRAIEKETAIRKYIGLASAKRVDWENDKKSESK